MRENFGKNDLTTGVVWKKLLIFFLPIAAGTCIQQLYNAVDGMIVGKFVGTSALAAVGGSSAQIINLLIGFFTALTAGASVVISHIYGAGKREDVQRASANAIAVCTLMGLGLMVFGLLATPWMLRILKTPEDTIPGSIQYLRIYFVGVPFILVLNMESNTLRAVGDSYSPFIYMVAGCVSNIVMDCGFVLCFHLGVAGVAIATVLAQFINLWLLTRKLLTTKEEYRLDLRGIKLNGRYISNMMKIGVPAGLQSSMYAVSNMIIQVAFNTLGTVAVASWSMCSKVDGIFWAVSSALGAAVVTFVGQNTGAGKPERVKACTKQGLVLSLAITLSLSGIIMLFANPLLALLTDDADVISTSFTMLSYLVPFYFTWTMVEILSAVLKGAGDAVKPVIIIGLGICLFRVVWMATVFAHFGTLKSLCPAYPVSWTVTGLALLIYYKLGKWNTQSGKRLVEK